MSVPTDPGDATSEVRAVPLGSAVTRASPLAWTKVAVPRRPAHTVPRPRLLRDLSAATERPLTLVVGPAGSGKTVLVSSWAAQTSKAVAWLALEPSDDTPRRFWTGVAQALQAAGLASVRGVGEAAGVAGESLVPELVNALGAEPDPVVLVLDDFHEVPRDVATGIGRLLELGPSSLRLVLVARRDPPIRLGRLRLAGTVSELRFADLSCTADETRDVVAAAGVRLSEEGARDLWRRTEGWMAAVRLAAASLAASPHPARELERLRGGDQVLSDYLVDEVLGRQPPDVQQFLLRTSIVDVLDAELAEALSGHRRAHELLTELAANGLLISAVDHSGQWFRYHALFAELLRAKLRWAAPELPARLHAVAARWFVEHGDDARAVHHAVAGADREQLADLAEGRWLTLLLEGGLGALAPIVASIPEDLIRERPELALALAAIAVERGDGDRARELLDRARDLVATTGADPSPFAIHAGVVELGLARLLGDREGARSAAEALLETRDLSSASGGARLRSLVLAEVGAVEAWTGDLGPAVSHLTRAAAAAAEARSPWLSCVALAHLAAAQLWSGEPTAAERRAAMAIQIAEEHGWTHTAAAGAAYTTAALVAAGRCAFTSAARLCDLADGALADCPQRPLRALLAVPRVIVLSAANDPGAGQDLLAEAAEWLGDWPVDDRLRDALIAWEGRLRAAQGDRATAWRLLGEQRRPERRQVLATLGRLHVADNDFAAASAVVAGGLQDPSAAPAGVLADLWLVEAMALDGLLAHDQAAAALERALDGLEAAGSVRVVVAHGHLIRPLLHRAVRTGAGTEHRALVERCLHLIDLGVPATRSAVGLNEPLSARERQVLRFMPTRMTNREIADELFLSVNTIKTHARAIYRKLDAEDRSSAVERAQQLRLLAPPG